MGNKAGSEVGSESDTGASEGATRLIPTSVEPKDIKDLLRHVDLLFHTRINFLLATEALLFNGLARLFREPRSVTIAISVGGALLTILMFASLLNLSEKLRWLQDEYTKVDRLYAVYRDVRLFSHINTRKLYTFIIPGVLLLVWVVAAIYFKIRVPPVG